MGVDNIKLLDWDSDFFGCKVGELLVENFHENLNFSSFDLIYLKGNSNIEFLINGFEQTFFETKIVYAKKIVPQEMFIFEDIISIKEINIEKNKLYFLAFESGKYSRFLMDSKFGIEKFKLLYKKWIDNSIDLLVADDVFLYINNNIILGFVTYKIHSDIAQVGLIAVDNIVQGKGIGTQLLKYLEVELLKKNIYKILIPTQSSNKQACSFYEKLGYYKYEQINIKHYWKI